MEEKNEKKETGKARQGRDSVLSVRILNTAAVELVAKIFDVVSMAVSYDEETKVRWDVETEPGGLGVVSVTGPHIEIQDPMLFQLAVLAADNFEVIPKTDGTLLMNLTFHGMMIPVKEDIK